MNIDTSKHSTPSNLALKGFLAASTFSLMLAACGGGGDESGPLTYQGQSADSVGTERLKQNAASATGESLGTSLGSLLQTMNESAAINRAFGIPGLGMTASSYPEGVFSDPTDESQLFNDAFEANLRTDTATVFESSLGLTGTASTSRTGNTITIDPDEVDICFQQSYTDLSDKTVCEQLLADLTVQIDADTDQSGLITYLFRNQSVVEIEYSPVSGSYELKLAGLHLVLLRMAELDPEADPAPDSMAGSIRLAANVLDDSANASAGTFSIIIPEAISIVNVADGTDTTIAPSTILQLTADAGTGSASLEVSIGALMIATRNGELENNPLQKLALSGLTARADLTRNGNVLTMSNVGLGNGPLILSVDSLDVIRATLDDFGFSVNQETDSITLNSDFNYSVALSNVLGYLDPFTSHDSYAEYTVTAPSGSVFTELAPDVMRVAHGGPITLDFELSDGNSSATGIVNINQGECFGDSYESDSPIDNVVCGQ